MLAAERATARDLEIMEARLAEMERVHLAEGTAGPEDLAFHLSIYEACHNPLFGQLLSQMREAFASFWAKPFDRADFSARSFPLHRPLFEASAKRDSDMVRRHTLATWPSQRGYQQDGDDPLPTTSPRAATILPMTTALRRCGGADLPDLFTFSSLRRWRDLRRHPPPDHPRPEPDGTGLEEKVAQGADGGGWAPAVRARPPPYSLVQPGTGSSRASLSRCFRFARWSSNASASPSTISMPVRAARRESLARAWVFI